MTNQRLYEAPNSGECEHHFEFLGLHYCAGKNNLPGGGAKRMYYAQVFFCNKCMKSVGKKLDVEKNSYEQPIAGSHPGSADDCCVPLEDR